MVLLRCIIWVKNNRVVFGMSISGVSSLLNSPYSYSGSSSDIQQLQKRIVFLENQIKQIQQGNDDAETKEKKIQQIEQQIQLIEMQIQQKKNSSQKDQTSQTSASLNSSANDSSNLIDIMA